VLLLDWLVTISFPVAASLLSSCSAEVDRSSTEAPLSSVCWADFLAALFLALCLRRAAVRFRLLLLLNFGPETTSLPSCPIFPFSHAPRFTRLALWTVKPLSWYCAKLVQSPTNHLTAVTFKRKKPFLCITVPKYPTGIWESDCNDERDEL
jgi:hypothetical protein